MRAIRTLVRVAIFWGEYLLLVPGSIDETIPDGSVGLPGETFGGLVPEGAALAHALEKVPHRGTFVGLAPVNRLYVPETGSVEVPHHVFLKSCDFFGYFGGVTAKPDKLPDNFDPMQRQVVDCVMSWRREKGWA